MDEEQISFSYYIYDSRYKTNPDDGEVMEVCDSLKEARDSCNNNGSNVIVRVKQKYLGDNKYETLSETIVQ